MLAGFARDLEAAGAACIVICTNTMHKLADTVQSAVTVPLLHITDVTGQAVKAAGVKRPLLLATRYTMEQDFYLSQLRDKHGIAAMAPMPRTARPFTTSSSANSPAGSCWNSRGSAIST